MVSWMYYNTNRQAVCKSQRSILKDSQTFENIEHTTRNQKDLLPVYAPRLHPRNAEWSMHKLNYHLNKCKICSFKSIY